MTAEVPTIDEQPGGLHRQVGSALRWSALNSLIQRVCQLGVSVLLARLIAPEQFGVFAVALVVLNIVLNISELGVSVALVRHTGPVDAIAPTVTTLSLLSGFGLAGVMVVGAPWFASGMQAPQATGVIQLMSVALVIAGASAVPGALLQRDFRQDHKFAADTAGFVVGTTVAVVLALTGFGAWSLAWSRIATNLASAAVLFAVTRPWYRPGLDPAQARELLAFGLPLAGSSFLVFAVLNADSIIVGTALGPVALALYTLAFNLSSWPVGAFSMPVRSVSLPAFSRVRDDPERFRRTFARALGMLALVTVPASALLAGLGGPLVRVVYGQAWADAAAPLALLVGLGAIRVAVELCYDFLASAGRSRSILAIHVLWLAVLVPALLVGARLAGIEGVAAGHVAVAVLVIVPAYLIAFRPFGVRGREIIMALARPVLGGVLMLVGLEIVQRTVPGDLAQLLVGGTAATALYVAAVFPLRHEVLAVLRRRPPVAEPETEQVQP